MRKKRTLAERFWPKIDQAGPIPDHCPQFGVCWDWTAGTWHTGYGMIQGAERALYANRVALEMAMGRALVEGERALHVCDRPICVRNDEPGWYEVKGILLRRWGHLFLGTTGDNARDMVAKGRNQAVTMPETIARGDRHVSRLYPERICRGERHFRARLTEAQVSEIRLRWARGSVMQKDLCAEYGISPAHMSGILSGRFWRHTWVSDQQNQHTAATSERELT